MRARGQVWLQATLSRDGTAPRTEGLFGVGDDGMLGVGGVEW